MADSKASGLRIGWDSVAPTMRVYLAFAAGDREAVERPLTDDFAFSSRVDGGLDRAGYFELCWPGAGGGQLGWNLE